MAPGRLYRARVVAASAGRSQTGRTRPAGRAFLYHTKFTHHKYLSQSNQCLTLHPLSTRAILKVGGFAVVVSFENSDLGSFSYCPACWSKQVPDLVPGLPSYFLAPSRLKGAEAVYSVFRARELLIYMELTRNWVRSVILLQPRSATELRLPSMVTPVSIWLRFAKPPRNLSGTSIAGAQPFPCRFLATGAEAAYSVFRAR